MAWLSACKFRFLNRTLRGQRAADGASFDALRPFNNSVNIEDQHEISLTWETIAPSRWFPSAGRSPFASTSDAGSSPQENILATSGGVFRKRQKREETGRDIAQWRAAAPAGAET